MRIASSKIDSVLLVFFVSGFGGLIYQSIWSHYAKLFLGHAAYAQTLVLVVFIGGLAIGAAICSRIATRVRNPLRAYALVELAIGLIALVSHRIFVGTIDWSFTTLLPAACSQATTFCPAQWIVTALLLAPQSILLGATFPLVSSAVLRLDRILVLNEGAVAEFGTPAALLAANGPFAELVRMQQAEEELESL